MDGGAWWAVVHGVARSWTRLSDCTFNFHFHALEKEMATHSNVLAWRIPGKREPGGLPSMGSHRVGHNWSDLAAAAARATWGWKLEVWWSHSGHRGHAEQQCLVPCSKLITFVIGSKGNISQGFGKEKKTMQLFFFWSAHGEEKQTNERAIPGGVFVLSASWWFRKGIFLALKNENKLKVQHSTKTKKGSLRWVGNS